MCLPLIGPSDLISPSSIGQLGFGWRSISGPHDPRGSGIRLGDLHHRSGPRLGSGVRGAQGSATLSFFLLLTFKKKNNDEALKTVWINSESLPFLRAYCGNFRITLASSLKCAWGGHWQLFDSVVRRCECERKWLSFRVSLLIDRISRGCAPSPPLWCRTGSAEKTKDGWMDGWMDLHPRWKIASERDRWLHG